ncbi:MAG: hypothetical protein RJB31_576 [Bacteroidota bacterium]
MPEQKRSWVRMFWMIRKSKRFSGSSRNLICIQGVLICWNGFSPKARNRIGQKVAMRNTGFLFGEKSGAMI